MFERRVSRRELLQVGAMAALACGFGPTWFLRRASAQGQGKRVLVVVFQRGAVDGLNMVVPYVEGRYYDLRPNLAIPEPGGGAASGIDLDGSFALHPGLAALVPAYQAGELAFVHAVGSPDPTRSHFDAQDYMETGIPGDKNAADGWINRHFQATTAGTDTVFRGLALDRTVPRALTGSAEVLAVSSLNELTLGGGDLAVLAANAAEQMYGRRRDLLGDAVRNALEALDVAERLDTNGYQPANGAEYPGSDLGAQLREIALLVKAGVGLEVAFLNVGGWDTHSFQGASSGQLAGLFDNLAAGLAAFRTDLGAQFADVCVLTLSEFGRTAAENGAGGTDHGRATSLLVCGGTAQGGKVYGDWPGLGSQQLFEGRDLAVTTDFRTVAGEILQRHLGSPDLAAIFPGFSYEPLGLIA